MVNLMRQTLAGFNLLYNPEYGGGANNLCRLPLPSRWQ
ncbi:hypothetical protein RNAN_1905 [Rheinheimera nanhaiensis E407-8]|uniref:Uncharacterized protein n=1 Tax=Rheinheimera nanhaiensis E407-8 TaxID=562729 RepID=I1DXY9_9GAMM|nr:hypothetical protein RNAN_1905 [Rheinheimera nanhaiensis E407-8]